MYIIGKMSSFHGDCTLVFTFTANYNIKNNKKTSTLLVSMTFGDEVSENFGSGSRTSLLAINREIKIHDSFQFLNSWLVFTDTFLPCSDTIFCFSLSLFLNFCGVR